MKFVQNMSKAKKIGISVAVATGVVLGAGLIIPASNSTANMSITMDVGGQTMTSSSSLGTGFANYGKVKVTTDGTTVEQDVNAENKYAYDKFISELNKDSQENIDRQQAEIDQLKASLETADEASKPALEAQIKLYEDQLKFQKDTINSLNTSYALMIAGSALLGLFGIVGIAWLTILLISKKKAV